MTITNEQIEAKAREICINLGMDPDERVDQDTYDGAMTPKERNDHGGWSHDMVILSPRWRNYRKDAAIYLAASLETLKEDE